MKQASYRVMRVTINTETKYMLWCAACNVIAHLYFTMMPYAFDGKTTVSSFALILSLITASIWIYGAKRRSERALIVLVPLGWLVCYHYSTLSYQELGQEHSRVIYIGDNLEVTFRTVIDLFNSVIPVFILTAYLASTLGWLSVGKEGFKEPHMNDLSHYRPQEQDYTSLSSIPSYVAYLPIYWSISIAFGIYFWSSFIEKPSSLTDLESMQLWTMIFWLLALFSIVSGSVLVILHYRLPSQLILESLQIARIETKWVGFAWLVGLIGLMLIMVSLLK